MREFNTTIAKNKKENLKIDLKKYAGSFKDDWFGTILISEREGHLFFKSIRSPKLAGEIFFYKDQNFVVKWDVRSFNADSHIFFDLEANGDVNHFTMKAISPMTDFSYDFHDLDFRRAN